MQKKKDFPSKKSIMIFNSLLLRNKPVSKEAFIRMKHQWGTARDKRTAERQWHKILQLLPSGGKV